MTNGPFSARIQFVPAGLWLTISDLDLPSMTWCIVRLWYLAMLAQAATAQAAPVGHDAPIPIDAEGEAKLLAIAGDGFRIERTDHFVIAHNTSEETLANFLNRAERTYDAVHRLCRVGKIPVKAPTRRLEVLFFDAPEGFARYGQSIGFDRPGASGIYSPDCNRAAFFNTLNTPPLANLTNLVTNLQEHLSGRSGGVGLQLDERKAVRKRLQYVRNKRNHFVMRVNRLVIQHEVAHQVLYNAGVHTLGAQNPGWLVEGLACLFETPPTRSGAGFGTINQMRLRDFRECLTFGTDHSSPKPEYLTYAYRSGRFVPLKKLIGDAHLLSRLDNPDIVYLYAEAWSLVHYLQRGHQKELAEYIRQTSRRRPGQSFSPQQEVRTFEAVFGPIDERFERRWVSFILRLPYKPSEAD